MNKIVLAGVLVLTLFSCKKKEFDYISPNDFLTGGSSKNWFLTELYVDEELQVLDSCVLDDTLVLSTNTDFKILGGETPCSSDIYFGQQEGVWRTSSDDRVFFLFGTQNFGYEGTINSMSSRKFTVTNTYFSEERKYVFETK